MPFASPVRKTLKELADEILDDEVSIELSCKCHACDQPCKRSFRLPSNHRTLRLLIAGFPCVDFTVFGERQQTNGKTMIVIICLLKLILTIEPDAVILENVPPFDESPVLAFVKSKLALAGVDILNPTMFGFPINRHRKYVLLLRNYTMTMTKEISDVIKITRIESCPSFKELLFSWDIEHEMNDKSVKNEALYQKMFPGVVVINQMQNPQKKPCKTCTDTMFTLTTGSLCSRTTIATVLSARRPFLP
jgi:site-specific DNA-cytosine methylase